ncbi:MAG TPA: lytic transglycosylase domain-containing protein [Syntrophomonadaceae bacterium]|nr:lytic transglycosylase domain-containing protein [Syntrophomonadaceae bacterium]
MRIKAKSRVSLIIWIIILLFLAFVFIFPRWISFFYPLPHQELVFTTASEEDVDPYLVFAIIRVESKYQTGAESPKGAKGLMQIMPETAEWIAEQKGIDDFQAQNLHDPEVNIQFGCWYLRSLQEEFGGNETTMIAAYNAGRGRVKEWIRSGLWDGREETIENIPYNETEEYVRNVLKTYHAYRAIYD